MARENTSEIDMSQAYAWGRLAKIFARTSLEAITAPEQHDDIVVLDLCSAFPLFRQITLENHREACRSLSKRVLATTINELHEHGQVAEMFKRIVPKKSIARELARSAVQDVLFTRPTNVRQEIARQLNERTTIFDVHYEPRGYERRGGWEINVEVDTGTTFAREMGRAVDYDHLPRVISQLIEILATNISPYLRRLTFITADIEKGSTLAVRADNSFPQQFRTTQLFTRARALKDHVQSDVLALPFADETINLITSFEGWPYYLSSFGNTMQLNTAARLWRLLKPGGKMVIWPLLFQNGELDGLYVIADYWQKRGATLAQEDYDRSELERIMVDRELVLAQMRSPIFQSGVQNFPLLLIEKR